MTDILINTEALFPLLLIARELKNNLIKREKKSL